MQRAVWLALFCLVGIGGLFSIRSVVGVSKVSRVTPEAASVDVIDTATPLPKGDRLPSRFFDSALPKPAVETVKIVPAEAPKQSEVPRAETSKDDVVSWHWHEGAKVVRRRRPQ
jgi:hypothetical protein